MEEAYGTKLRLLRILIALVEQPRVYTKKRLIEIYNATEDKIKHDFNAFRAAGLLLDYDGRYRYYFKENKPLKQLRQLLHFTEEDQLLLAQAIDQVSPHTKRGEALKKKLASLYDYHRLGHAYLRKPYLSKVDLLMQAKAEKWVVVLENYRSSNSNNIEDRLVEPFHISPPDDTLQAYDVKKKKLRHFRISRIRRVKLTEEEWSHENSHNIIRTDPFRIVDNDQVMVHLKLRVGAYNELVERFPQTKSYLLEMESEDCYDFQCLVNHNFIGLTNFILGYHHQLIEVVEPEALRAHLRAEVEKMKRQLFEG